MKSTNTADRIEIPKNRARRIRQGYLRYQKDSTTYVEVKASVATPEEKSKSELFLRENPSRSAAQAVPTPVRTADDHLRLILLNKANYRVLSAEELMHMIRWATELRAAREEEDRKRQETKQQIEKLIVERGLKKEDVIKLLG